MGLQVAEKCTNLLSGVENAQKGAGKGEVGLMSRGQWRVRCTDFGATGSARGKQISIPYFSEYPIILTELRHRIRL